MLICERPPRLAKWAIGRAFRHAGDQASIEATLAKNETTSRRKRGSPGSSFAVGNRREVRETASQRLRSTIRLPTCGGAAEGAAAWLERQQFAIELLQVLSKTRGGPAWSYLEAVVELADPWLLNTRGDPLFLWDRILGNRQRLRNADPS